MLAVSMLAASLWAGSLALGLESSASAQRGSGLNWVPGANGQVPQNAVSGGQERGRQLFVCRARYQGGVHPGKIVGRNCNIGYGGREITVPRYEVLTSTRPNRISWQAAANGQIPPGAVVGGQEPGRQLYICRAPYQGGVHPGKLVGRNCNIGWGGNEVTLPRYEVMVLASRRPQPNPPPVVVPPASSMPTFRWSSAGPIRGMVCTQTLEPADPHTWSDNYFCANQDIGMRWSYAGPIRGMECTQILETADPHTWSDNYLCVPRRSSVSFRWSSAGPIRGMQCVQWLETADPHTWSDNYLCY
jgi:hypothetical protein